MFTMFGKVFIILGLFAVGLFFRNILSLSKSARTSTIGGQPKVYVYNYIGDMLLAQIPTAMLYLTSDITYPGIYFMGMVMVYAGFVFHIKDMTGKNIEIIVKKLHFTIKNLKDNVFMRLSVTFFLVFLLFFITFIIFSFISSWNPLNIDF